MQKIIIDCDPGIDDSLALIYAVRSNEFEILGITTVAGNVPADEGAINACKILSFLGVTDIPVYVGEQSEVYIDAKDTHGENGLGNYSVPCNADYPNMIKDGNAVKFITDTVDKYPGEVTIVALGPLTNISKAINSKDTFLDNVKEIVSMGGTFRVPGNCTPVSEYNYWCDPFSASNVFENVSSRKDKFTMIGLDVTRKIVLTHNELSCIKFLNPELGELIEGITEFYFEFHKKQEGLDGCVINDPLVIFYLLNPSMFEVKDYYAFIVNPKVSVESIPEVRGMVMVDENNIYRRDQNIKIAVNVDEGWFWCMFENAVLKKV